MDDPHLKYRFLARFDRDMISLARKHGFPGDAGPRLLHEHSDDKVLAFERAGLLFAFNFHPQSSYTDYRLAAPAGKYGLVLNSDAPDYGGHNRLEPGREHFTLNDPADSKGSYLRLYLPSRTAQVLQCLRSS